MEELLEVIKPIKSILSIHDFRIVGTGEKMNLIFDAVVASGTVVKRSEEEALRNEINLALQHEHPKYNAVVSIDRNYLQV